MEATLSVRSAPCSSPPPHSLSQRHIRGLAGVTLQFHLIWGSYSEHTSFQKGAKKRVIRASATIPQHYRSCTHLRLLSVSPCLPALGEAWMRLLPSNNTRRGRTEGRRTRPYPTWCQCSAQREGGSVSLAASLATTVFTLPNRSP